MATGQRTDRGVFHGCAGDPFVAVGGRTQSSSSVEVIRAGLNEAELIDLGRMAKQDGITLDEAILSFGWHESFVELADEVARR